MKVEQRIYTITVKSLGYNTRINALNWINKHCLSLVDSEEDILSEYCGVTFVTRYSFMNEKDAMFFALRWAQ